MGVWAPHTYAEDRQKSRLARHFPHESHPQALSPLVQTTAGDSLDRIEAIPGPAGNALLIEVLGAVLSATPPSTLEQGFLAARLLNPAIWVLSKSLRWCRFFPLTWGGIG